MTHPPPPPSFFVLFWPLCGCVLGLGEHTRPPQFPPITDLLYQLRCPLHGTETALIEQCSESDTWLQRRCCIQKEGEDHLCWIEHTRYGTFLYLSFSSLYSLLGYLKAQFNVHYRLHFCYPPLLSDLAFQNVLVVSYHLTYTSLLSWNGVMNYSGCRTETPSVMLRNFFYN